PAAVLRVGRQAPERPELARQHLLQRVLPRRQRRRPRRDAPDGLDRARRGSDPARARQPGGSDARPAARRRRELHGACVIRLGPQLCGSLDEAARREWLVTDGVGGYAMGTVAGLGTRRYHGLLVVAISGPADRMLGLVALEPVLVVGDARHRLAVDEWSGGVVDPRGNELLVAFELEDGVPRWRWQVGDVVVEREVAMTHGRPAVGVLHRLVSASSPVRPQPTPLCTRRSRHGARFAGGDPAIQTVEEGFVFEDSFRVAGGAWEPGGSWYRGVRAREEAARGLNDVEDVWAAGSFAATLAPGDVHQLTAAAAPFDGT